MVYMKRMEWEKPYIKEIITSLNPKGRVLEIGFNMGYGATCIREFPVLEHVIIEKDPSFAQKAREFALKHPGTKVIEGNWEQEIGKLGHFDTIFFNEIQMKDLGVMREAHHSGSLAVNKGKETLAFVENMFPDLKKRKYSAKDLEEFYEDEGKNHPEHLSQFLFELYENHQITHELYHDFSKKHHLKLHIPQKKGAPKVVDPAVEFLQEALKKHMVKGARFSMFCTESLSKYEDPLFFDAVITNPNIEFSERLIDLKVPSECPYYKDHQGLVVLVEKVV